MLRGGWAPNTFHLSMGEIAYQEGNGDSGCNCVWRSLIARVQLKCTNLWTGKHTCSRRAVGIKHAGNTITTRPCLLFSRQKEYWGESGKVSGGLAHRDSHYSRGQTTNSLINHHDSCRLICFFVFIFDIVFGEEKTAGGSRTRVSAV